jgi:hypothetical protein
MVDWFAVNITMIQKFNFLHNPALVVREVQFCTSQNILLVEANVARRFVEQIEWKRKKTKVFDVCFFAFV